MDVTEQGPVLPEDQPNVNAGQQTPPEGLGGGALAETVVGAPPSAADVAGSTEPQTVSPSEAAEPGLGGHEQDGISTLPRVASGYGSGGIYEPPKAPEASSGADQAPQTWGERKLQAAPAAEGVAPAEPVAGPEIGEHPQSTEQQQSGELTTGTDTVPVAQPEVVSQDGPKPDGDAETGLADVEQPESNSAEMVSVGTHSADTEPPVEPTGTDASPDDGRWDKQKAETMAAVLQNDRGAQDRLAIQQARINLLNRVRVPEGPVVQPMDDELASGENSPPDLTQHQSVHEDAVVDVSQPAPGATDYSAQSTPELPAQHEALPAAEAERLTDRLKNGGRVLDGMADKQLSPYVELYDSNPDKFAKLSAAEFMQLGKELTGLDTAMRSIAEATEDLTELAQEFTDSLEAGHSMLETSDEQTMQDTVEMVCHGLSGDPDVIAQEVEALGLGSFGVSTQEAFGNFRNYIQGKLDELSKKQAELTERRQKMLSGDEPDSVPAAASAEPVQPEALEASSVR